MKKVLLPVLALAMVLGIMLPVATPVTAGAVYNPDLVEVEVEAGGSYSFDLELTNLTDGLYYSLFYAGLTENHMPDIWVDIESSFTAVGTSKTIPVTIDVPIDAAHLTYGAKIKYQPAVGEGCKVYITVIPHAPGPATSITIAPDGESLVVGETLGYTATADDGMGHTWDVTAETTFSSGAGSFSDETLTAENEGTWDVTGEYNGLTDTVSVTVAAHGEAVAITIAPDGESLVVGETLGYTATADDGMGHTWDVTAETTFSSGAGSFSDETLTAENEGTWDVTGEYNGLTDTVSVTVAAHGEAVAITIAPDGESLVVGETLGYTATADDGMGHTWDVTAETTFSSGAGSFSDETLTAENEGTWDVTGEYNGLTDTVSVTVAAHGEAVAITIAPDGESLVVGETLGYTATADDGMGHTWDVTAETTFSSGAGSFSDETLTAENEGIWTVTGTYGSLTGDASVTVLAPEPGTPLIIISPSTAINPVGTTHTFTAKVYDDNGIRVYNAVVTWTIISGPGSLVTPPETITDITGRAQVTITSDEVGTTVIRATVASLDISGEAEKIWIAAEEPLYFTVDFLGEITRVPMSPDGRILTPLAAPSPDGLHLFEMAEGTRVLDAEGNIVILIEIRDPAELNVEPDMVIITAFVILPPGITFDGEVWLTLGYEVEDLPEDVATVDMAYYNPEEEWIEIDAESDVIAGVGEMSSQIEGSGIFGILAETIPPPPPAVFTAGNLNITRAVSKTWDGLTFIMKAGEDATISVYITNYGGQDGIYTATLMLNGKAIQTKEVSISQGSSNQVVFNIYGNEPGSYTVKIGGLTGTFTSVLWINWWLIAGLVAAFGLIVWSVWYYKFHKKKVKI